MTITSTIDQGMSLSMKVPSMTGEDETLLWNTNEDGLGLLEADGSFYIATVEVTALDDGNPCYNIYVESLSLKHEGLE